MVKLPDSSNLRRNIPQATSAIQSVPVAMDFQAMQGAGQQLQQTGNRLFAQQQRDALYEQRQQKELLRQQEKQENELKKLRVAQATSRINMTISSTLTGLEEEQDYTKHPQILDNQFKKLNETMSKDFSDDPIGREWINLKLNEAYNEANIKIYERQKTKQKDAIRASTFQASDDFIQQFALAKTPKEIERLKSDFGFIADSATGAGGFDREEIQSVISDTLAKAEKNRLDTLTDEEVIEEFGGKNNEGGNSDAVHLLKMSKIEASYNPRAVNSITKKKGLGQFDEATARENGVTDPFDSTQAIKGSMTKDKKDSVYFEQQVGRKPVGWERYLIHQQGVGGAPALIKNADKNVVDALMTVKEYRDNPEGARMAVVQNGGSVDMTAGEFANLWRDKYENTDISDAPEEIINVVNSVVGGNDKSTVSQGYIMKRLNKAEKAVREKKDKKDINDIVDTVITQYPDDYKVQIAIVGSLDITPDQRKKVMTILDSNKKRQETIERDNAEQLSYKAIEYINNGGLFENMPADISIQLNASQRSFLQSYSNKVNNIEGNKAKQKQSELLEYTKVRSMIADGDIDALKKEYPPEKAVAVLSAKHYEQYLNAINPKQDVQTIPGATEKEENRRISAVFSNIGISNKRNASEVMQQGLFYDKYYDAKELFIADNGRKPKGSEIQDILDGLVKERVVGKGFLGGEITKKEFELTDKDMPIPSDTEKESILSALLKKDPKRDWSDEDVQKVYNVMQGKK